MKINQPQASATLTGNANERGSREYNLALGQAVSFMKALVLPGVSDKKLETVSYGREKPVATGHDESAWSQNRHTDIRYQGE